MCEHLGRPVRVEVGLLEQIDIVQFEYLRSFWIFPIITQLVTIEKVVTKNVTYLVNS